MHVKKRERFPRDRRNAPIRFETLLKINRSQEALSMYVSSSARLRLCAALLFPVMLLGCQASEASQVLDQRTWKEERAAILARCASRTAGNAVAEAIFDERERPRLSSLLRPGTRLEQWVGTLRAVEAPAPVPYAQNRSAEQAEALWLSAGDLSLRAYNLDAESLRPRVARETLAALQPPALVRITASIRQAPEIGDVCASSHLVLSLDDVRAVDVQMERKVFFEGVADVRSRLAALDRAIEATGGQRLEGPEYSPRYVRSYATNLMDTLGVFSDPEICRMLKDRSLDYSELYESVAGKRAASLDCTYRYNRPARTGDAPPWTPDPHLETLLSFRSRADQIDKTLREAEIIDADDLAASVASLSSDLRDTERQIAPKLDAYDTLVRALCAEAPEGSYGFDACTAAGIPTSRTDPGHSGLTPVP
jgi:hypothetical protein